MRKSSLGEFEHQVLLTALRLDGNGYAAAIVVELEARARRSVTPAAVHIALARLDESGLVRSQLREDEGATGRRLRRYVSVTPRGLSLLRTERQRLVALWSGLEPQLEGA